MLRRLAFVLLTFAGLISAQSPPDLRGRISARPGAPTQVCTPGLRALGAGGERDGVLFVPAAAKDGKPLPLLVLLHGAYGNGRRAIGLMQTQAERESFLLLAPDSREPAWDFVLRRSYGPDVDFLNSALQRVFAQCPVDAAKITLAGVSDGAGYALSLGLTNGDLFTRVIAFSPCFVATPQRRGSPEVFISHGTRDKVLPIKDCSRPIVRQLQRWGYRVRYREFNGPHTVPPEMVEEALSSRQ